MVEGEVNNLNPEDRVEQGPQKWKKDRKFEPKVARFCSREF